MVDQKLVTKVAQLANLEIEPAREAEFLTAFAETVAIIDQLQQVDVAGVEPTTRLSSETNRWRRDDIDEERVFTQAEALSNAGTETYQGYFVVERVIDHEG